ncbi:MAG: hypothetical protein WDN07_00290 [Actinomycetota bacterium]
MTKIQPVPKEIKAAAIPLWISVDSWPLSRDCTAVSAPTIVASTANNTRQY